MSEKYLNANGIQLAYEEFGDNQHPPVILIMGLGTQMIAWPDPFCESLVDNGFRVIRFDNRDIGLSEKFAVKRPTRIALLMIRSRFGLPLRVPYSLADMAQDTVSLMDALEIQAAHVVGASMGGMIAQLVAAKHEDRCLSLTSVMSSSGNPRLPGTSWEITKQLLSKRPAQNEEAMLAHAKKLWALIGSPGYPPSEAELEAKILRSIRRSYHPAGYQNQLAAILHSGDRRPMLQKITAPTLVIHGKADALVPVECGIDTAKNIDSSNLTLIEGMGHDLPKELLPRMVNLISEHVESSHKSI